MTAPVIATNTAKRLKFRILILMFLSPVFILLGAIRSSPVTGNCLIASFGKLAMCDDLGRRIYHIVLDVRGRALRDVGRRDLDSSLLIYDPACVFVDGVRRRKLHVNPVA